jgi:adenylate kinase family enzyme
MEDIKEKMREEMEASEKKNKNKNKNKNEPVVDKIIAPRIPDDIVYKIIIHKLNENVCKNKGYILDGYPRNIHDSQNIFEELGVANAELLPNFIFKFTGHTDEFLKNRIKTCIDHEILTSHHYTDEAINKRLNLYKNIESTDPITNYFSKFSFIEIEEIDCKSSEKDIIENCRAIIEKVKYN